MTDNTHVWLKGLPKTQTSEKRLLDFKANPVEYVTLDQLNKTVDERNTGQRPMNGIRHIDLFKAIIQIFDKQKIKYELKPIAATEGGPSKYPGVSTFPVFVDQHGKGSLQSMLLRRLIGLFVVKENAINGYSPGLAVAFHQDGIQMAFGPNLDICANMCIIGASMRMQTYGNNKIDIDKMQEVASNWLHDLKPNMERQVAVLEHFKKTLLTYRDVSELVGHMTFIRIGKDKLGIKGEYPLKQGHISKFTEDYLIKYRDLKKETENPEISLYDLYNMGTALHKPETTEIPVLIGNNTALSNLFMDKFVPAELRI